MPSKKQELTSTKRAQAATVSKSRRTPDQGKPQTKRQQLIDLLSGKKPVTVEMVSKTLNWQPHTVRAAITGLRKTGFAIGTAKPSDGGATCYHIVGMAQSPEAST